MSHLMTFQNELVLSYSEKRKLAHAIKALRASEDNHYSQNQRVMHNSNNIRYNNGARYPIPTQHLPLSDSVIPLIPERTSSSNEQVLDFVKSFNIPKRPLSAGISSNRHSYRSQFPVSSSTMTVNNSSTENNYRFPISPSSPRVGDEGQWIFMRRRTTNNIPTSFTSTSLHQHMDYQSYPQQFIHVTKDSDTFHNLQVTGMHDPRLIKNTILRKLGLEGQCERYFFFHENGKNSEVALTDNELAHLCQISDHSSTNRILVKPADHALEHYKLYSKDCYDIGGYQRRYYAEPRLINSSHNSDYDFNSPLNRASPQEGLEDSRDDSGYFDRSGRTSRKQSIDADAWPSYMGLVGRTSRKQSIDADTWYGGRTSRKQSIDADAYIAGRTSRKHSLDPTDLANRLAMNGRTSRKQSIEADAAIEIAHRLGGITSRKHSFDADGGVWSTYSNPNDIKTPSPLSNYQSQRNSVTSSSFQHDEGLWPVPQEASEYFEPRSVPPEEPLTSSQSLWAIPPQTFGTAATKSQPAPTHMLTSSVSLWAVAPSNMPQSSLWAVPPSQQAFEAENINLHPSISSKLFDRRRSSVQVEGRRHSFASQPIIEERLSIDTQIKKEDSPPSSPTFIEENWAERPSVERLYKDIDKYLPGYDLDKEIILEQQTPAVTLARRLAGHKKSIRNVAREAHRNWKNAVNVIRSNSLLRRHSTKMWHRAVEQVKPGHLVATDVPKSKKLQWIRGELIGKGSFGRVYHALNVEAGEWIAVKQVDVATTKADLNNPQLRKIKEDLFREISLLEDLDNEYIVQYLGYDVDEEEGSIHIFLEYVPGGSISSCLSKTGKFDAPVVRFFTRQILMGLAYLHNRNILHRDIKAGNILLDQNGTCKITDFGLSKLSGQDKAYDPHSNNSVMRGTVFWMAPEVVKGTNYNAKVDIWSLGCTVIEMMTGKHPWLDLNMLAALYSLGKYQAPPIPEDIPDDAKDFLNKCFIINPEERPTAEQLLSHPFVQPDPSFDFRTYMKKVESDRCSPKRTTL